MLSIVTFKWKARPDYRSQFTSTHVNTLASMVKRHYPYPHDFCVVTDDPAGIGKGIRVIPMWTDHVSVLSLHGVRNPSCYRRLKLFSAEAAQIVGPRFVVMDLDMVITGDLRPLFDRPEDFVIMKETDPRSFYNGSLWMLTAGARRYVWDTFTANPALVQQQAKAAGRFGSDQAVISHLLGKDEATWSQHDGVYSFRVDLKDGRLPLPKDARVVNFHGGTDPDNVRAQRLLWVQRHYQ